MSRYLELLQNECAKKNSLLCFGMDPVVERMKIDTSKNLEDEIVKYFTRIFDAIAEKVSAVKPNAAFYLQYGTDGLAALVRIVEKMKSSGMPVIIDGSVIITQRTPCFPQVIKSVDNIWMLRTINALENSQSLLAIVYSFFRFA